MLKALCVLRNAMIKIKPTKKIFFTTTFLLAVIIVSEFVTTNLNNHRNNEIYQLMKSINQESIDTLASDMESNIKTINLK